MKRFSTKKLLSVFAIASFLAVTSASGDTGEEEAVVVVESKDETISYKFATVLYGDVKKTERMKCTYRQTDAEEITVSVTGRVIDNVYVKEGDFVNRGDLLCELSAGSLEESIATLEYRIARNELLLGYLDVNQDYDISRQWLYGYNTDSIKASVESIQKNYRYKREDYEDSLEFDRKELSELRAQYSNSKIYAKTSGTVYELTENLEGKTSKKDEVIMTIVNTDECLFLAESPELIPYFTEGQSFTMNISTGSASGDYELEPYDMENWGDTQLFSIVSGPDGYSLEVGMYGTAKIVVEEKDNCLYLPQTVVHTADGEAYVYILDENNTRQVRFVETGLYGDDTVEIVSGLEEGEKVVKR